MVRKKREPALRFLGIYAVLLIAIYSAIPYKTPWCVVTPLFGFCILGGIAAETVRWTCLAPGLIWLGCAAFAASGPFDVDQRNPWVYAHTGRDVFLISERVQRAGMAIDVYSSENLWPLPWYLRKSKVNWWRVVPLTGRSAPVVLVTPELEADLTRKLYESPPPGERELYVNLFDSRVELRPGVEVRGYVANSYFFK